MINDDLNRRPDLDNRTGLNRRDSYVGGPAMWIIGAVIVFGLLLMWAPWNGPRVADNTAPGTTTGSSINRPAAPSAPAPAAPAAPSTNR